MEIMSQLASWRGMVRVELTDDCSSCFQCALKDSRQPGLADERAAERQAERSLAGNRFNTDWLCFVGRNLNLPSGETSSCAGE